METAERKRWLKEASIRRLEALLAPLEKRARKLGVAPPGYVLTGARRECSYRDEDTGFTRRWIEVEVLLTGPQVRLAGWIFRAVIEHLEPGVNIVRNLVPAEPVDERFRSAPPACQHCNTARNRKDTYLVRNEGGREIEVGRNCLQDFIGSADAERAANLCEFAADCLALDDDESLGGGGGYDPRCIGITEYMAWCVASIAKYGWVSRGTARERHAQGQDCTATANDASEDMAAFYSPYVPKRDKPEPPTEAQFAAAAAALEWARALPESERASSEYLYNVWALSRLSAIEHRHMGIVASIATAHRRYLEREVKRAEETRARATRKPSAHFGTEGQRVTFGAKALAMPSFDGNFGARYVVVLRTDDGDIAKWWTGSPGEVEVGRRYRVVGTVKRHNEYKGELQTELQRCTCEAIEYDSLAIPTAAYTPPKRVAAKQPPGTVTVETFTTPRYRGTVKVTASTATVVSAIEAYAWNVEACAYAWREIAADDKGREYAERELKSVARSKLREDAKGAA